MTGSIPTQGEVTPGFADFDAFVEKLVAAPPAVYNRFFPYAYVDPATGQWSNVRRINGKIWFIGGMILGSSVDIA